MDVVTDILEKSVKEAEKYKPITVNKLLELDYDLGTILACDNNDLIEKSLIPTKKNDYLLNITRDNVQLLLNKVWELPTARLEEAIVVKLPPSKFVLPRTKPIPKSKSLTKWQQFAKSKGIQKKKKPRLSWDEQLKKWVPSFGYKRAIAEKEKEWVLEIPANSDPMEDQFAKKKAGKSERISKNELQRLRNIAKAKNVKVPRMGLVNPDAASAKDLQTAVTVARSSTASLGKFQDKLPKEREAHGISEIIPGANRKRKMPPVGADHERKQTLEIIDGVLSKRPKFNIEKIVARHINKEQIERSEEKQNAKPKPGKRAKGKSKGVNKKPSSSKTQRKGKKGNAGRKRR